MGEQKQVKGRSAGQARRGRTRAAAVETVVELIRREDIVAEVGTSCSSTVLEAFDDDDFGRGTGSASPEEENRLRILAGLLGDPRRMRPALVADNATVARLDALARTAPNMARPLALVGRLAALSAATGRPLSIPPLVLVSGPGTGKTRFAGKLAAALGTGELTLPGTSINDDHAWLGTPVNWRSCGIGGVAKALLAGPTAGPVIVTDEAEKVGAYDRREHPLDVLLPLLEPSTARTARDKYLDLPMRCDGVIWIFCCNSLDRLSVPFLDRCIVMDVPDLHPDERTAAALVILDEILGQHGLPAARGRADEVAAMAARDGMRNARRLLLMAVAGAVASGRKLPQAADVRAAQALLGGDAREPRRPIGFFPTL